VLDSETSVARGKKKIVDKVRICLVSGSGGNGCVSFDRQRHKRVGAPNGGDGGRGGNVVFQVKSELTDLSGLTTQQLTAPRGENGASSNRRGKNGADLIIAVPPGTSVTEYVKRPREEDESHDVLRPAPIGQWARDLNDTSLLEQHPEGADYVYLDGKLQRLSELRAEEHVIEPTRGKSGPDQHVLRLGQGTLLERAGDYLLACRGGRGGLGNAHFASSTNRSPETVTRGQLGETKRCVLVSL
jgi:GTP-binding protein